MHGDELSAVRERCYDLDFRNHLGDAVDHLVAGEHVRAGLHQVGHAVPAVAARPSRIKIAGSVPPTPGD